MCALIMRGCYEGLTWGEARGTCTVLIAFTPVSWLPSLHGVRVRAIAVAWISIFFKNKVVALFNLWLNNRLKHLLDVRLIRYLSTIIAYAVED